MAIRLAALDVDGTLLAPDNSITPATRQAIREAKDAGLEIVVCTGRSFVEVQDILRQLPEVRYLSCGTGAYALDVWTMEMLYECSMPSELGKAAYRADRAGGLHGAFLHGTFRAALALVHGPFLGLYGREDAAADGKDAHH